MRYKIKKYIEKYYINEYPNISIIIPVHNGAGTIKKCLNCILKQNYPINKIEVIVIDNASNDNTKEIVNKYDVKYIYTTIRGVSAARNRGIKIAKGDILLFLDADCFASENLVQEHVYAHLYFKKHDPKVKAVGGGIEGYNKNFWAVCDDFSSWYLNHPNLSPRIVNTHPTANLSISSDILNSVTLFDESLEYAEDYVFCSGLIRKGYQIYFHPSAKVKHLNRQSFKKSLEHSRNWTKTQYQIREKGFVKRDFLQNILKIYLYYIFIYVNRQMLDMFYYSLLSRRYKIILYFPFAFLIRIQFFYYEMKEEIRFMKNNRIHQN